MNPLIATVTAVHFIFEVEAPIFINYLQIIVAVFAFCVILQTLVEYCFYQVLGGICL